MTRIFHILAHLCYHHQTALFERVAHGEQANIAIVDKDEKVGFPKLCWCVLDLFHTQKILADLWYRAKAFEKQTKERRRACRHQKEE